jgi:uncharacterized protein
VERTTSPATGHTRGHHPTNEHNVPTRDQVWPNGTPCWIDLMVTDPDAAKHFYSGLFGWDIQDGPPEVGRLRHVHDERPGGHGHQPQTGGQPVP